MYRTIETRVWHDKEFKALPAPGKLLFIYLITNPHAHVSGFYYLPNELIVKETGLKADAIDKVWDRVSGSRLAFRDDDAEVVWVKNMLRFQGRGEKLQAAAANQLLSLHKSPLTEEFLKYYPHVGAEYRKRVSHRASGSGLKEQDQDKDQDKKRAAPLADEVGRDGVAKITWRTVYEAYPKKVKPGDAEKAIPPALRHIRDVIGITTPSAWLLDRVELYAAARRAIEAKHPGAMQYTPGMGPWLRAKRYEEDPIGWEQELPGFAMKPAAQPRRETSDDFADRIARDQGITPTNGEHRE